MTCFNQAAWIEQALDSVVAQTEQSVQLIVTDDWSTDTSRTTIEQWLRCHPDIDAELVYSDRNIGLAAILNRAVPLIRGRYLVILNADDWFVPERLEVQARTLDTADPAVGVVYSDIRVVDEAGAPTGEYHPHPGWPRPEGNVLLNIITQPTMSSPMIMFRRTVLDKIGEWDEALVQDDYDFMLRVAAAGVEFAYLPHVVLNYRWHGSNLTSSRHAIIVEGRVASLRKLLGRDPDTDRLVHRRLQELVHELHVIGYDRQVTRRHLFFLLRQAPTPQTARELTENLLRLSPGTLSPTRHRLLSPLGKR